MHMRRIIPSPVDCPALSHFSSLSRKRYDFKGENLLNTKCVSCIYMQFSSDKIIILGRVQEDTITNVQRSSSKVPVPLLIPT